MCITDGTFVCNLCGEWLSGCALCGIAPMRDERENIRKQNDDIRLAKFELYNQERSIRDGNKQ